MKHTYLFTLTTFLFSALAFAGNGTSGGGDVCEQKIQFVRDSLKSWINKGGPRTLNFTSPVTIESYSSQMKTELEQAKIRCVKAGDNGYPVQVNNTPKVCRFDKSATDSVITCDFASFAGNNPISLNDQFTLIHHEYAGLAGLENPSEESSSYWLSSQITSPDRPLSATILFSGFKPAPAYTYEHEEVTIPFGPLKYEDGERFIHHNFSASPNCEIHTEIVTDLDESARRKVTIFSWLFMKNRGANPDLAKEKLICGPSAGSSVFTIHLGVPDKTFADLTIDSDILGGSYSLIVEGINISFKRFNISFSEE